MTKNFKKVLIATALVPVLAIVYFTANAQSVDDCKTYCESSTVYDCKITNTSTGNYVVCVNQQVKGTKIEELQP